MKFNKSACVKCLSDVCGGTYETLGWINGMNKINLGECIFKGPASIREIPPFCKYKLEHVVSEQP